MLCIEECFDVTCTFTIDDLTYNVTYKEELLEIQGELGWHVEKTINFVSCGDPGSHVITGKGNQGNCNSDGLLLHCVANEVEGNLSP